MLSVNFVWVATAVLLAGVCAQDTGSEGSGVEQCTCSGLDYTDGGSYLVDGNSENEFTFTSVFEGRKFQSSFSAATNGDRMLRVHHHPYPCVAERRRLRMLGHRRPG